MIFLIGQKEICRLRTPSSKPCHVSVMRYCSLGLPSPFCNISTSCCLTFYMQENKLMKIQKMSSLNLQSYRDTVSIKKIYFSCLKKQLFVCIKYIFFSVGNTRYHHSDSFDFKLQQQSRPTYNQFTDLEHSGVLEINTVFNTEVFV